MTFRDALAALREQQGLSQTELALLADYDPSCVSRIENGTRVPSRTTIERLGQALGVSCKTIDALMMLAGYIPARAYYRAPAERAIHQALTT